MYNINILTVLERRVTMEHQLRIKERVERYGLESVPEELRQTKWFDYVVMQGSFAVNTGNFLVPAFAVLQGGLSILAAIISTTIGAFLAFICVSTLSIPGAKYGVPAQFAFRSILGVRGAQWLSSPVRAITSLYWFAVQTIGGTYVLQEMLKAYFHVNIPFSLLAVFLGTIMAVLALIGFNAIKKSLKQFFPILLIGQGVILFLFFREILANNEAGYFLLSSSSSSFSTIFFYASLAFVQYVAGICSSSDITRYARNYKHGFYGLLLGNVFGMAMAATLGATSAGFFNDINPFVASSQLAESKILIIIIFVSAMLSMISINLNNAYTGGYCLLNCIPRLGRINASIAFGTVAIALCTIPSLVNEAKDYISFLGLAVIPLAAVVVADFSIIKKGRLMDNVAEQRTFKFNKVGLIFVAIGVIMYAVIPEQFSPGFITFVTIGISYSLLMGKKNKQYLCNEANTTQLKSAKS